MLILSLLPLITLHLAPISISISHQADRVDCNIVLVFRDAMNICSSQGILPSGEQYRHCTVYCALHSRPLGEILLSLAASHLWPISSHLGSGTHGDWCHPIGQSEASTAPGDQ